MEEVRELSGEEAEMKCFICNYMYIWREINSLSFTYTAPTDAQGTKRKKMYVILFLNVIVLYLCCIITLGCVYCPERSH